MPEYGERSFSSPRPSTGGPAGEGWVAFAGFMLGLVEGLTKVFYTEASNTVIFIIMAIVLMIKPAGLFGRER